MLGDNSIVVPPDPIPNSEVKRNRADGSVGSPHVRVGHRQTPKLRKATLLGGLFAFQNSFYYAPFTTYLVRGPLCARVHFHFAIHNDLSS